MEEEKPDMWCTLNETSELFFDGREYDELTTEERSQAISYSNQSLDRMVFTIGKFESDIMSAWIPVL